MPVPHRCLRAADVERYVRQRCFAPASEGLVGVELERPVYAVSDQRGAVDHADVRRAVAVARPLLAGSAVTFEPGGQLEVSSPPRRGASAACSAADTDMSAVDAALAAVGLEAVGIGLDPRSDRRRVVDEPRYRAMEAYFEAGGATSASSGRSMMCNTASVQVNLDVGEEASQLLRWRLVHRLGPLLVAVFANSPFSAGATNGLRSGRWAVWTSLDATRTAAAGTGSDPVGAWTAYALAARVMLIRRPDGGFLAVGEDLPFARWLEQGHELGHPTMDDLEYHLGTLFPPVRPRGWLELRVIDALPDPWWRAAVAVCAALLDDGEAAERAMVATAPVAGLWAEAARLGLAHPALAAAARICFGAALDALPRQGTDEATAVAVAEFADRFVDRGRCPADDLLDQWRRNGTMLPPAGTPEAAWT